MKQDGTLEEGDVVMSESGSLRLSVRDADSGHMRQIYLNSCVLYGGVYTHKSEKAETYICNVAQLFDTLSSKLQSEVEK
jgi:hypothetical protein